MIKTLATSLALGFMASTAAAGTYTITVTNNMQDELLAPVLVTDAANDKHIFAGDYVTAQAEEQILTGDPGALAKRIGAHAPAGHRANVAHGSDGPPGVLLAPGKSLTFVINTEAETARVLAMVAPTDVPDNYVTAVIDLKGGAMDDNMMHGMLGDSVALARYDIGHDEGTKTITPVAGAFATVSITENN